jgi:hypothetical protein
MAYDEMLVHKAKDLNMPRRESIALRATESAWAKRTSQSSEDTLVATYTKLAAAVSRRNTGHETILSDGEQDAVRQAVSGLAEASS